MSINFEAANMVGYNNPGTEIITLVKDGSSNFINPPSYDKMRAYLSSGEVPMLFVTAEGGETGILYQLVEYSETENKIRFSNSANAIEFCAGCEVPAVVEISPAVVAVTTLHINVTAVNMETMEATFTADKTPAEMQQAALNGPIWCVVSFEPGTLEEGAFSTGLPPAWMGGDAAFGLSIVRVHEADGNNKIFYAVRQKSADTWGLALSAFAT